jgi:hypothetical protein
MASGQLFSMMCGHGSVRHNVFNFERAAHLCIAGEGRDAVKISKGRVHGWCMELGPNP